MCGKRRFYGIAITVGTVCLLAAIVINLYRNDTGLFQTDASSLSDEATSSFVLLADVSYENTVLNYQEAMQAAEDLGLCKSASDLVLYNETQMYGETFYQLQQIYEGIDVYGHSVSVLTDENGNITAASGNFVSFSDISTTPSLSWADATNIALSETAEALDAGQISFGEVEESVIFLDEEEEAHLAYLGKVLTDGEEYCDALIDANSGTLLETTESFETLFSSSSFDTSAFSGVSISLYKEYADNDYYTFYDDQRNLILYDALKSKVIIENYDKSLDSLNIFFKDNPEASVLPAKTNDTDNIQSTWIYAYAGTALTYDYFLDILERDGFDGYGNPTCIICNGVLNGSLSSFESTLTNANAQIISQMASVLTFEVNSNLAGLNIISHEYSHNVEKTASFSSATGDDSEYSAIRESISDVFAELVEAWSTGDDPDWIYSGADRKLYPDGSIHVDNLYDYDNYKDSSLINRFVNNSIRDCHSYSTISSYAIYLIWDAWRKAGMDVETAMTYMSRLLYRALFLFHDDICFQDFAYILYTSGIVMNENGELTDQDLQIILDAFNAVNIDVSEDGLKEYEYKDWTKADIYRLTEAAYAVIATDSQHVQTKDAQELAAMLMLPYTNLYAYDEEKEGFQLSSSELSDYFYRIYGDYSYWDESSLDALSYFQILDDGAYFADISLNGTAIEAGWELTITDTERLKSVILMTGTLKGPKSEGSPIYNVDIEFERAGTDALFFRNCYTLASLIVKSQGSYLGICSGEIYDAETGEPIEGVKVSFNSDIYDYYSLSQVEAAVYTDEDGYFSFGNNYEPGQYSIICQADGYEDYTGTIEVIENSGTDGVNVSALNEIYMEPSSVTDAIDSFDTQIATLVAQYGVIATGTDSYDSLLENIDNTAETFSSSRISGLLCADIYDYDMDGTDELMVLRVDPGSFSAGDLDYASTNLYVSIYESTERGVILAAEKQLTLTCGLGWGNTSNVFSLFRYISQTGDDLEDDPPQVNLGFDYYCNLSGADLTFGLIALTYDGANLLLADGLECMEDADENYAAMYVASDEGALTNLTGRMYRNEENGWSTNDRNNGDGFYVFEGDFTDYEACFDQLLRVRFDLWDELAFRSMYGELNVSSVSGLAYIIGLSPAELYDDSSITELCTIQAPWYQGGITLTCEDDSGLLDSYRGNADTNSVETDSDETIIVLSATIDG